MNSDDPSAAFIISDALFSLLILTLVFVSVFALGRNLLRMAPKAEDSLLKTYSGNPISTELSQGEWDSQ